MMRSNRHAFSRKTTALVAFGILLLASPLSAQFDLSDPLGGGDDPLGGRDDDEQKVEWKVRVEPATIPPGGVGEVVIEYKLDKGWYIYSPDFPKESTGVATGVKISGKGIKPGGKLKHPEPEETFDELLKETHRKLKTDGALRQQFQVSKDAAQGELEIEVLIDYQSCDKDTCLQPVFGEKHAVQLKVEGEPVDEKIAADPESDGLTLDTIWGVILLMIGGGLFALVMPCTYPMIPITISVFTKQAEARDGNVLPLALFYGFGIIVSFNIVGVLVGVPITTFAATWWVNLFFGIAFLLFALSFFDVFTIRPPKFLDKLAGRAGSGGASGGYLGVTLLGATLVITSFTCTAPIMGLALGSLASGENASIGRLMIGMTAFGVTMALPFVLLALFPAKVRSLPRSGEWMHTVKVFLGFLELAAALKFFSNADLAWFEGDFKITSDIFLLVWAVIFGVAGLYLLNLIRLKSENTESIGGFRMLVGLIVVFLAAYFYECSRGLEMDWVTQAMAPPPKAGAEVSSRRGRRGDGGSPRSKATWTIVLDDVDRGLAAAREKNTLAFINFTGHT